MRAAPPARIVNAGLPDVGGAVGRRRRNHADASQHAAASRAAQAIDASAAIGVVVVGELLARRDVPGGEHPDAASHDVRAVAVAHRIGHLEVGDLAVVVATGAVHRGPALEACRALIDDLKQTVPIWKEQHLTTGGVTWVGLP